MPIGMSSRVDQYTMPAMDASEDDRLGFLTEVKQEGENFQRAQRYWGDIDKAVEIISGGDGLKIPSGLSTASANIIKRDIRENVATLANMRPISEIKTQNDDFQHNAKVLHQMYMSWYYSAFTDRSIREWLQYGFGVGLGWASPGWEYDPTHPGLGDIAVKIYGPRDVLVYGLPKDKNVQKAYIVTICDEMPVHLAMRDHPLHQHLMVPEKSTPTWMRKGIRRVQRFMSPLLNAFGPGGGKEKTDSPFPTVTVYKSYIMDGSVNMTGETITMGKDTNWQYDVPSYESQIETSVRTANGEKTFRPASAEDAKMFPIRRLVKWTKEGIIYDDTATSWHGMVPAIPLTVDDWPWDFQGCPATRDGAALQASANRTLRAIDDTIQVKFDMPLMYDQNALSQSVMDRVNPRRPKQRIKVNMQQNEKPIQMLVPPEYYNLSSEAYEFPKYLHELIHYQMGTKDMSAVAKAKQIPSGDSLEKMMELAGPLVTDIARGLERANSMLGTMWKGLAMQHYTLKRRVEVLGKDGVTKQDLDFDPGNMIPSHTADEMELIKQGKMPASEPSRVDIVKRARAHINTFAFSITPNSMNQLTSLTRKMLYLQLTKAGFPIDPWTVAEVLEIPNFGSPTSLSKILDTPKEDIPDDVLGRWIMFKEVMAKLAPQQGQPGRKGSGQTPPKNVSKDGGNRTTTSESPR